VNQYKAFLSLRLDDAFRDVAAGVVDVPTPAQLRTLAHPNKHRPVSVHLPSREVPSAAYKPTHGGYPDVKAQA
jgi:hypothetical protein